MEHSLFTRKTPCLIFILAWMIFSPPVSAFEPGSPTIGITGGNIFSGKIDEAGPGGEVEGIYTGISLKIPVQLNRRSSLSLNFGGERVAYDWDNPENLYFSEGNEPWDELFFAGAELEYVYNRSRQFSAIAGVNVSAGWEDGTEDAYSHGAYIGGMYRTDSGLNWIFGMGVFLRPEDTLFFPMLGLSWKEQSGRPGADNSGLYLKIGAPETEIRYAFTEFFDVYCNFELDMMIYRLEEGSRVSSSGLVEMTNLRSGLFVDIRPIQPLQVSVGATYLFGREWEIQNKNGDKIRNIDIEDAFGAKFSMNWTF